MGRKAEQVSGCPSAMRGRYETYCKKQSSRLRRREWAYWKSKKLYEFAEVPSRSTRGWSI